jgi:tetratricopeptide (TPR) repeat protein
MQPRRTDPLGKLTLAWGKSRLYGRWWVTHGWTSVRVWRRIVIGVVCLALVLVLVRKPVGDWLWPESRIQQLLEQGHRALSQGRLSAQPDGARELFLAAAALDPDRRDVQAALVSTGQAALQAARNAMARAEFDKVPPLLAIARELQMPHAEVAALDSALQQRSTGEERVDVVFERALAAQQAGHLDGDEAAALPLFQQVLSLAPDHMQALEQREDALSDLLLESQQAAAAGDIVRAAALLERVTGFDPGHFNLPDARAALSLAVEQRRQQAERDRRRGRLLSAASGYAAVLDVFPEDSAAHKGQREVAEAYAAETIRLAGDFEFVAAEAALQQARALALGSVEPSRKSVWLP